jgi:hypothetical protein
MIFIISIIIFAVLLSISIIVNINTNKRHINLFDEESIKKLKEYKYKTLEIKRKRRAQKWVGQNYHTPFHECPPEMEYPEPGNVLPAEDIIEVYGKEDDKEYLLYKTYWSKDGIKEIINIVNEMNKYFELK